MTGTCMAMASTWGRPQPSPRDGSTNARAAAYSRARSDVETLRAQGSVLSQERERERATPVDLGSHHLLVKKHKRKQLEVQPG